MSKRKIFTAAALAATAVLGLAGCDTDKTETSPAQEAIAASAGLNNVAIDPTACKVTEKNNRLTTAYDFYYGAVVNTRDIDTNWANSYAIPFNTIANPTAQTEIQAAYSLLPPSPKCTPPLFAPTPTPPAVAPGT